MIFKGFTVPQGYILHINTDPENPLVKYPGEYSGSTYTLMDVIEGKIPAWELTTHTATPPQNPELFEIFSRISMQGGESLFVGGVVRDLMTGRENKDIDIEVYGLGPKEIENTLSNFGRVDVVGASFGVIKLTTEESDYDFSLPRRESKSGSGHRGFIVEPDPTMTPKEAASRRDYTINSLAMTPEGEILDFFGGLKDLEDGVLRHTSSKFSEDPLRVLRGFQFAARFNMTMDTKTADLCRSLRSEYRDLPRERVWTEWEKWATKGYLPSRGLRLLEDTGWLELYPELFAMVGVMQDPEWHPEGDVWEHTLHVCDMASVIAERDGLDTHERTVLLFAALCHDLGKPSTTHIKDNGRIGAPGHAEAGADPTKSFLTSIGAPQKVIDEVVPLVVEHMAHVSGQVGPRMVRRLANRVSPSNIKMLTRVVESDHSGRPPLPRELPENAREVLRESERLKIIDNKPVPVLGGKHLLGLAGEGRIPDTFSRPGPHFGILIEYLFNKQLDGEFSTEEEAEAYTEDLLGGGLRGRILRNLELLGGLTLEERAKLAESAVSRGIEPQQLLDSGEELLISLLSD